MSPVEFYELPQGTPSVTDVASSTTLVGYCTPSDVAALNKPRAAAWGLPNNVTTTDVNTYIVMTAGQIDGLLSKQGYSVPVNTASFPEAEGLLSYVNAQGAAYMVEEASPHTDGGASLDRTKAAFDAAMKMLADADFAFDLPVNEDRAEPRAPWITLQPTGQVYDPQLQNIGGFCGDGISSGIGEGNPANPYMSRQMRF